MVPPPGRPLNCPCGPVGRPPPTPGERDRAPSSTSPPSAQRLGPFSLSLSPSPCLLLSVPVSARLPPSLRVSLSPASPRPALSPSRSVSLHLPRFYISACPPSLSPARSSSFRLSPSFHLSPALLLPPLSLSSPASPSLPPTSPGLSLSLFLCLASRLPAPRPSVCLPSAWFPPCQPHPSFRRRPPGRPRWFLLNKAVLSSLSRSPRLLLSLLTPPPQIPAGQARVLPPRA